MSCVREHKNTEFGVSKTLSRNKQKKEGEKRTNRINGDHTRTATTSCKLRGMRESHGLLERRENERETKQGEKYMESSFE